MASTYTTNIGVEKMGTGDQPNTWGTTTNTNFDIIDQAINGVVVVTLPATGSTGSPNDVAITDGALSDGRNKYIEVTDGGDLGGTAYVRITPNDAEKILFFRNNLSGGRAVIVFQGTWNASNDIQIDNGVDAILKFDGGGAGAVVENVFNNLAINEVTVTTYNGLPTASTSTAGIVELATTGEVNGSSSTLAITPNALGSWTGDTSVTTVGTIGTGTWQGSVIAEAYLPNATTTGEGVVELATQAEVDAGTDTGRVVTCETLANYSGLGGGGGSEPDATETVRGVVEIATQSETDAGVVDNPYAVTPLKLENWSGSANINTVGTIGTGTWQGNVIGAAYLPDASTSAQGVVEIANNTETNQGSSSTLAVSPSGLSNWEGTSTIDTVGTITSGTWQGSSISTTYITNLSGTNTGDEPNASTSTAGVMRIATQTDVNNGTVADEAVTPATLAGATGLNASTLGGFSDSEFLRSNTTDTASGALTFNGTVALNAETTMANDTALNIGQDAFFDGNANRVRLRMENACDYLSIWATSVEKHRINKDGTVAFGDPTPPISKALSVYSSTQSVPVVFGHTGSTQVTLAFDNTTVNGDLSQMGIRAVGTDYIGVVVGDALRHTFHDDGRVGHSSDAGLSPESALHIQSDDTAPTIINEAYGQNPGVTFRYADGTVATPGTVDTNDTLGIINFQGYASGAFQAASAGINVTATENFTGLTRAAKMELRTAASGGSNAARITIDGDDSDGAVRIHDLTSNGIVYNLNGSLTHTNPSDRELKKNIEPIPYGLSTVMALNPVGFEWKHGDTDRHFGLIAQEVGEVIPEIYRAVGKNIGLKSDELVPVLIKAIQDLAERVKKLESKKGK